MDFIGVPYGPACGWGLHPGANPLMNPRSQVAPKRRQTGVAPLAVLVCIGLANFCVGAATMVTVAHVALIGYMIRATTLQMPIRKIMEGSPTPVVTVRIQAITGPNAYDEEFNPENGTVAPTGSGYSAAGMAAAFSANTPAQAAQNWLDVKGCAYAGVGIATSCVTPPWDYTTAGDNRVVAFYAAASNASTAAAAKASVDAWVAAGRPHAAGNSARQFVLLTATTTAGTFKTLNGSGTVTNASDSFAITGSLTCPASMVYDTQFATCIPTAPGPDGKCDVFFSAARGGFYKNSFDPDCADPTVLAALGISTANNVSTATVTNPEDGTQASAKAPTNTGPTPNVDLEERVPRPEAGVTGVSKCTMSPNGNTGCTEQTAPGTGPSAGPPVTPTPTTPGAGSCGAPGFPPCQVTITNFPEAGAGGTGAVCGAPPLPACKIDFGTKTPNDDTPLPDTPPTADSLGIPSLGAMKTTYAFPVSSNCPGTLAIDSGHSLHGTPLRFDDGGVVCQVMSVWGSSFRALAVAVAWIGAALFFLAA